jgi:NhaA family Na+:H+ antiporter
MILASLIVGKIIGITFFSGLGAKLGFPMPEGMGMKHLVVAGTIAGLGLTVALFVAGQAFPDGSAYQGPAKMGAVLSAFAALAAVLLAKALGIKPLKDAA